MFAVLTNTFKSAPFCSQTGDLTFDDSALIATDEDWLGASKVASCFELDFLPF
jgi:hypothetical protein